MFSLKDLKSTKHVVFNIKPVKGTDVGGTFPTIQVASKTSRENIDVSTIVDEKKNLLESLTADSTLREQNTDLGLIYSVGYGINYAQNRAQLPRATFLNTNGGKVTKGYVGDNSIKPITANLIL